MTQFPSNSEFTRLEKLAKYSDLYEGRYYDTFGYKSDIFGFNNEDNERLYYVACNITSLISEYFADMIVGDGFYIDVEDETAQEKINEIQKRNNLNVRILESAITQSAEGFTVLRVRDDEGEAVVEEVPENQYFPYFTGTITPEYDSVVVASFIDEGEYPETKTYLWKEVYTKENDVVYIEYQYLSTKDALVRQNDKSNKPAVYRKIQDKQLPLSKSPFPNLPEGPQATEFTEYPLVQINNIKRGKDDYGKSDYQDIQQFLNDISFQLTQLSAQLTEHGMSRLIMPQGSLDKNGQLVSSAKVIEVGNGEAEPKYINNQNAQIDAVFSSIKQSLSLIASITKMPPDVLGLEAGNGAAKTATEVRLQLFNPMRKVSRKRAAYEVALENLARIALKIEGIEYDGPVSIRWDDVLPVDEEVLTATISNQVASGLKSRKKAIKELQGLDVDELEEEMADIAGDNSSTFGDVSPNQDPNAINDFLNA